jgi:hypothetical protein
LEKELESAKRRVRQEEEEAASLVKKYSKSNGSDAKESE